jgi:hypothetical protein
VSVLGIVGSAGGFFSIAAWTFLFVSFSPSAHGEIAPLLSTEQVLVLAGLGISSALGLAAAIVSRGRVRTGGLATLIAGVVTLASLFGVFSDLLSLFPAPIYGWWAIDLIVGGFLGIRTETP